MAITPPPTNTSISVIASNVFVRIPIYPFYSMLIYDVKIFCYRGRNVICWASTLVIHFSHLIGLSIHWEESYCSILTCSVILTGIHSNIQDKWSISVLSPPGRHTAICSSSSELLLSLTFTWISNCKVRQTRKHLGVMDNIARQILMLTWILCLYCLGTCWKLKGQYIVRQ